MNLVTAEKIKLVGSAVHSKNKIETMKKIQEPLRCLDLDSHKKTTTTTTMPLNFI